MLAITMFNQIESSSYLIIVIFFTLTQFLENKIYTEKTRKLRQNTQKIANFLRYYAKIHSKWPIFRVKSVKIYTGQKNLHENSRGFRDKYEVCSSTFYWEGLIRLSLSKKRPKNEFPDTRGCKCL